MKKYLKYLIVMLSILTLVCAVGCGSDSDDWFGCDGCDDEIDDMYATYGSPEEIDTYDSGDYHSYTYWYWCSGFAYTFTWDGCSSCDVSLYTFSPICM